MTPNGFLPHLVLLPALATTGCDPSAISGASSPAQPVPDIAPEAELASTPGATPAVVHLSGGDVSSDSTRDDYSAESDMAAFARVRSFAETSFKLAGARGG